MAERKINLEIIEIPQPCAQGWATMRGDDRVRFCGVCEKNVYNLSAMNRAEAEALIVAREGRLCVRFFKREDGTVVTADCSPIRKAARRVKWAMATAGAAVIAVMAGACGARATRAGDCIVIPDSTTVPANQEIKGEVQELQGKMLQGSIALPPPASQPATAPAAKPRRPV